MFNLKFNKIIFYKIQFKILQNLKNKLYYTNKF